MNKKTKQPHKALPRRGPSDLLIKTTYARLGLVSERRVSRQQSQDFTKPFERCSVLQFGETSYSSHSGI
jgi:hypothetical protein